MVSENKNLKFERIVGVKFLKENELPEDFNTIKNPGVKSFCDAFRLLNTETFKDGIVVTGDSIKICHWSPVGLGLREPETEIQKKIDPVFEELNHGIFIFNVGKTYKDHPLQNFIDNPDTVTLMGSFDTVSQSIEQIGIENFSKDYIKQLEFSAFALFTEDDSLTKKEKRKIKRHLRSARFINSLFASRLISNKPMVKFITRLMTKYPMIKFFDGFLRKFGTALSCCYVSSSIPYASQKGTVSIIDTGSIGWGEMSKKLIFMGLPFGMYKTLETKIDLG